MSRCRAFVLPGEEDFGIAAVEAQAAGAPVIALGRGGALETVVGANGAATSGATGIFFAEPTAQSLRDALTRFETLSFDEGALRGNAERFDASRFEREMKARLETLLAG
jgi:glycosyltransferase involved in cell wall biosynthesis